MKSEQMMFYRELKTQQDVLRSDLQCEDLIGLINKWTDKRKV